MPAPASSLDLKLVAMKQMQLMSHLARPLELILMFSHLIGTSASLSCTLPFFPCVPPQPSAMQVRILKR